MFGIGTWEVVVILILALIILGPDKLPGVARSVGKNLNKLRRTADEIKQEIDLEGIKEEISSGILEDPDMHEIRRSLDLRVDIRRAMANLQDPPPLPGPDEIGPGSDSSDDGSEGGAGDGAAD